MKSWETVYVLKYNFAASYLDALEAEDDKAGLLRLAYKTSDLKTWAKKQINEILAQCKKLRAGRILSGEALSKTAASRTALEKAKTAIGQDRDTAVPVQRGYGRGKLFKGE